MKFILIILFLSLSLVSCAPNALGVKPDEDMQMGGTCEIDQAGWQIEYIQKYDRHVFTFWVEGGDCEIDE